MASKKYKPQYASKDEYLSKPVSYGQLTGKTPVSLSFNDYMTYSGDIARSNAAYKKQQRQEKLKQKRQQAALNDYLNRVNTHVMSKDELINGAKISSNSEYLPDVTVNMPSMKQMAQKKQTAVGQIRNAAYEAQRDPLGYVQKYGTQDDYDQLRVDLNKSEARRRKQIHQYLQSLNPKNATGTDSTGYTAAKKHGFNGSRTSFNEETERRRKNGEMGIYYQYGNENPYLMADRDLQAQYSKNKKLEQQYKQKSEDTWKNFNDSVDNYDPVSRWDSVVNLINSIDRKPYEDEINALRYTDPRGRQDAEGRLNAFNDEREKSRQNILNKATGYFSEEFYPDTWEETLADEEGRQAARESMYNRLMPEKYADRVANMTPEEKAQLDAAIDSVFDYAQGNKPRGMMEAGEEWNTYGKISKAYGQRAGEYQDALRTNAMTRDMEGYARQNGLDGSYDPALAHVREVLNTTRTNEGTEATAKKYYDVEGRASDQAYFWMNFQPNGPEDDFYESGAGVRKEMFATPEMVETFNALYKDDKKNGTDRAGMYLKGINNYLEAMFGQYKDYNSRLRAEEYPVTSRILSYPENVIGGMIGTAGTVAALAGVESAQNKNSWWYDLSRDVQAVRDQQNEDIADWAADIISKIPDKEYEQVWRRYGKDATKFLLNVGDSIGDNLLAMGVAGKLTGNVASKAGMSIVQMIMSGEATSNAMFKYLDQGKRPDEAAIQAISDGVVEWITERVSLEALLAPDMMKTLSGGRKAVMSYIRKATIAEGSEEINADLLNMAVDSVLSVIYQHPDEMRERYNERLAQLIDSNVDPSEADKQASRQVWDEKIKEIGLSGLAGAISGGVMAGARAGKSSVQYRQTGAEIKSQEDGIRALVGIGLEQDSNSVSNNIARQLQVKLNNDQKITDGELGRLTEALQAEAGTEIGRVNEAINELVKKAKGKPVIEQDIQDKLNQKGISAETYNRSIDTMNSVADLLRGNQQSRTNTANTDIKGFISTEEEQQQAQGNRVEGTRGIIYTGEDGIAQHARLGNIKNGEVQVYIGENTTPKTVKIADISKTISANSYGTAGILYAKATNPNLYTDAYTNAMLTAMDTYGNEMKNLSGDFMSDARMILFAGKAGVKMAQTRLPQAVADYLYSAAKAEYTEARAKETEGAENRMRRPGQGRAVYDGAEYGTKEWTARIDKLNVSQAVKDRMNTWAAVAKLAGIEVTFTDNAQLEQQGETDPHWLYGSARNTGIRINVEGRDVSGFTEEGNAIPGETHDIGTTFSHETLHYLQYNSREGFDALQQYVMDRFVKTFGMAQLANRLETIMQRDGSSMEDAISEFMADSLDQIMANEDVIKHIQQTNKTLYQALKDSARNILTKIRNAITGMKRSQSYDAAMLEKVNLDAKELAKRFNLAWDEATSGKLNYDEAWYKQAEEIMQKYRGKESAQQKTRYSVAQLTDGTRIAIEDKNILEQKPESMSVSKYILNYLTDHINESEISEATSDVIYLGNKLPSEYISSKYTKELLRGNRKKLIIKDRAAGVLLDAIVASENKQGPYDVKHPNKNAKLGVYKYSTKIAFPVKDQNGNITKYNVYTAQMIVNHNSNGKLELYDILGIEKDDQSALKLLNESTDGTSKLIRQPKVVADKITQTDQNGNTRESRAQLDENEQKLNDALMQDMEKQTGPETHYGDYARFSKAVIDADELSFLNNQKTITTYRSMQYIDGKLYPPMAAIIDKSKEDATELGKWEKAVEHPELIKFDKNGKPKFTLKKGNGKSIDAAYNPYMHSSNLMLNDQFSEAWNRPNIVTVECKVPVSEIDSGYHAEYAKDAVGWHSWHTGPVAGQLRNETGTERQVFLSRWIKPVRVVSNQEVAQHYASLVNGTNIEVPDNVVTPQLLEELVKAGVKIKNTGIVKENTRLSKAQLDQREQELRQGYLDARDIVDEKRQQLDAMKPELQAWTKRLMQAQDEGRFDELLPEYHEWENGYTKVRNELDEAQKQYKEANKAFDDYIENRDVAAEQEAIKNSGLSEAEYRRKQAVNEFGYTSDFREAGYLLPNGRMLNFTGEKGKHYGMRGEDHRGIGRIYASSEIQNTNAMITFMNDGNIRVMAETPGVDINSATEPTAEQYAAIRNMARRFAGEDYFSVDFSDNRGNVVDSLEYDGRVNPQRVVNDIKTFYRTGTAPQQSVVSQFHTNEDFDPIRWSRMTEEQMDVQGWMMAQTPGTLQTEDERALWEHYRGLRIKLDLKLKQTLDYKQRIRELNAKAQQVAEDGRQIALNEDEQHELDMLQERLAQREKEMAQVEDEIYRATSGEGFARMMYQNNLVLRDYIAGKTQDQVRETVESMLKEVQAAQAQIAKDTEELKKLAQTQAVRTMKSFLGKSSLSQAAATLRKAYNSAMNKAEIENRLAEMALKQASGQDITDDTQLLAQDLLDQMRGIRSENLEYIRGTTLVIGKNLLNELKAENTNLKELRAQLKGSGVTLKTDEKSRFRETWQELRENNQSLPDMDEQLSESDALHTILDYVQQEMENSRGINQNQVDFDEAALVVRANVGNVTTYLTGDAAARAQIKNLMKQIAELSSRTEKTAADMEALNRQMDSVVLAGQKAKAWTTVLQRDVNDAIRYYNKTAQVAAQTEKTKVRKALIEQLRSENTKKLIAQQEKFREKLKNDKTARETAQDNLALRRKISTVANRMAGRLFGETDQKNIPEEAKPLVRQVLRMLVDHDSVFRKISFANRTKLSDSLLRLQKMDATYGAFDPNTDLSWLVIGEGEDADWQLVENVNDILTDIREGMREYRAAEGQGTTSLIDRMHALEKIQNAYSKIWSMVQARATAQIMGRKYEIQELAQLMEEDMADTRLKGNRTGYGTKARNAITSGVTWGNLTPEYYFLMLKNRGMDTLKKGLNDAENRSGLEALKAQARMRQIAQETGFATWDGQEKHTIDTSRGAVDMTTEQIMALYATWLREKNAMRPEETSHLLQGGFVLAEKENNKGKPGWEKRSARPIRMSETQLNQLGEYLTQQQKAYVDAVVNYMSTDLAELGNEASMIMYGIRKFTEQYYFPIKSWGGVLNKRSDAGVASNNENRQAQQGFSKRVRANANNAIEIADFTPTAMKHIVGMIGYNTIGPAVENMNKVLNQQLEYGSAIYDTEGNIIEDDRYKRNMRAAFAEHYGQQAYDYLTTFMKDINGGVSAKYGSNVYDKLLSVFKKSAVAGSLSVAAQQPLSYIRAAMMVNPKYLAAAWNPADIAKTRAIVQEMRKYSGVAVIKDMGKFDMAYGRTMQDYITPEGKQTKAQKAWNTIQDKATVLPQLMDTFTWARMWTAVKAEQQALNKGMDYTSDAFMEKVAERFNDLMRRTQVYDSTMVRSQNMRNQHIGMKSITSFMAEPTLSLNVLANAFQNIREKGGKTKAAKAVATFLLSAAAQAAVKALFSTGRTPDKKKTREENYLYKLAYNLINEANPLGLIPGFSQMIEALKNGEVTDNSMSVVGKAKGIIESLNKLITPGEEKNWYRDVEDSVGQFMQLFTNIPLKNAMRDFRAMVNLFSNGQAQALTGQTYAQRPTSGAALKYQTINTIMTEDLIGLLNKALGNNGYKTTNEAYIDRIYQAQKAGDTQRAEEMKEYVTMNSTAQDPEGNLKKELNSRLNADDDLTGPEKVQQKVKDGYSVTSIKKWITSTYKAQYIAADTAGRRQLMNELTKMYKIIGISGDDAMKIVTKWVKDEKKK